jgi:tRNA(Arg) A34 adenosine deaminase TadA
MGYVPIENNPNINNNKKDLTQLRKNIINSNCSLSCHAEISALNKYYKNNRKKKYKQIPLNKLTIVVIRIDSNGNLMNSKPCSQCISKIYNSGIKKVIYSTQDGTIITESVKNLIKNTRLSSGKILINNLLNDIDNMINIV